MNNSDSATKFYNRQLEYAKKSFQSGNLMPRRYVFILTNLCNLACSFCFQERKKRPDRMNLEDWLNLIKEIPKNSRITLTGGEPLVFKGFDKIFEEANKVAETNIVTNGLLLDDININTLLSQKNFKILAISIDNIGNTTRDFDKKKWEDLVEKINKFNTERSKLNNPVALDIKTVVLDDEINNLFEIHKFMMEELKADTHSLQLLKGADIQHSDLMFDFKEIYEESEAYEYKNFNQLVDQLNLIKEYDKKYNFKTFLHPSVIDFKQIDKFDSKHLKYLNNKKHIKENFSTCYAPWSSVHINVDGNLFPCMAVSMGNVKNESLKKIIFSEKFEKFKKVIKENGTVNGCNRCGWLKTKYHS